jgi:hypothetical protein
MSSAHAVTSVPSVRYRDFGRGVKAKANRELLIAAALFVALTIVGTAFFFAVAPSVADLASLYVSTT